MADGRRRRNLALVDARVLLLGVSDAQRPLFGVWRMQRLEALVGRVGVPADCQQVNVAMTNPRHLKITEKRVIIKCTPYK